MMPRSARVSFLILIPVLLFLPVSLSAQGQDPEEPYREYRLLAGELTEIEIAAATGHTLNKVFSDIYFRGFGADLPEKIRPITDVVWQIFWTFTFTMWPHDMGHWVRADQVGGHFLVHGYAFPFPHAEMHLPDVTAPGESTLTSTGGFEVNHLMAYRTHRDLYQRGWAFADELVHSFIQQTHIPFYAFLLTPARATKPETWTDTVGDPVEAVLSIYGDYTGRPAIRPDGSVDPELVDLYRETIWVGLLWTLADPTLHRSLKAFDADMRENHGLMRSRMWGDERFAWLPGTRFHIGPLGYELYLLGYLRRHDRFGVVYLRGGRPYHNLGLGVDLPDLIRTGRFSFGLAADLWDQDLYGPGAALTVETGFRLTPKLALEAKGTWKDRGWLLGRQIDQSLTLLGGFSWRF